MESYLKEISIWIVESYFLQCNADWVRHPVGSATDEGDGERSPCPIHWCDWPRPDLDVIYLHHSNLSFNAII